MQALGVRRSSFAKATALVVAASAGAAQVLAANPSRSGVAVLNKSDAAVSVFLCDLAAKTAGQPATVEIAAGQYWEDPQNYTGALVVEGTGTGNVNITEWQV